MAEGLDLHGPHGCFLLVQVWVNHIMISPTSTTPSDFFGGQKIEKFHSQSPEVLAELQALF